MRNLRQSEPQLARGEGAGPCHPQPSASAGAGTITDVLLKVGEAAKQLGVGKPAVRRILPAVVLGPKTIRYRQSDVTAIIAGNFSRQLVVNRGIHADQNGNKTDRLDNSNQSFGDKR